MITEFDMEQIRLKFLQLSSDYDYATINWNEYYSNPDLVLPDPLGDALAMDQMAATVKKNENCRESTTSVSAAISSDVMYVKRASFTSSNCDNHNNNNNSITPPRHSRSSRSSRRSTDGNFFEQEQQCNSPTMVIDSDEPYHVQEEAEVRQNYSSPTSDPSNRCSKSSRHSRFSSSSLSSRGRMSSHVIQDDGSDDGEAEYIFGESSTQSTIPQNRVERRAVIEDEVFIDDNSSSDEEDVCYVDDDDNDNNEEEEEEKAEYISDSDSTGSLEPVIPITSTKTIPRATTFSNNNNNNNSNNCELSARQFSRQRDSLLLNYYNEFNRVIFQKKLPTLKLISSGRSKDTTTEANVVSNSIESRSTVPVPYLKWNRTLRKTAGITKMFIRAASNEISAGIELSVKVCDNVERLRKTLAHEMCHLATFWLHRIRGHGETFFKYGALVTSKYPDIPVTTCHNYAIQYKYHFTCKYCSAIVKRHSKSLKTASYQCKICGRTGTYELTSNNQSQVPSASTSSAPRNPTAYNMFVKENFSRIRTANPQVAHKDIMKVIAEEYKKLRA